MIKEKAPLTLRTITAERYPSRQRGRFEYVIKSTRFGCERIGVIKYSKRNRAYAFIASSVGHEYEFTAECLHDIELFIANEAGKP
jgi:hypothetical protein